MDLTIKVPTVCLKCGSAYKGGHELPDHLMKKGLRVFYDCGASLSIPESTEDYCRLLFKGCGSDIISVEQKECSCVDDGKMYSGYVDKGRSICGKCGLPIREKEWLCSCRYYNKGIICTKCGTPKPQETAVEPISKLEYFVDKPMGIVSFEKVNELVEAFNKMRRQDVKDN